MSNFLNQLINGLHVGSIYALIALGYTMVYGIVRLINFAHGDIIMVGAYAMLFIVTWLGKEFLWVAALGGIGVMPGAMLGGFIMGIAESLTKGYVSTQLADAVVFGILIVVLLVKPSGIMGKTLSEKV